MLCVSDIMASSAPRKLQSQMLDALSCIICFTPYDLERRLPKAFPCLHTVCLACAEELCQQSYSSTFPCPTCRQPVSIPSQGAPGLKTNLDTRNIVEIMQKTAACSIANPDCSAHPSKQISHVCKTCEVGLCPRCITSAAMKLHTDHEVLELGDAFEEIKNRIDSLEEEGKKTCQMLQSESKALQQKIATIESCSADLLSSYASKNLSVFGKLRRLSALLNTTTSNIEQYLQIPSLEQNRHLPDENCTDKSLEIASDGLDHGKSIFEHSEACNKRDLTARKKLAAVTVLLDTLQMDFGHDGLDDTLGYLFDLCYRSELAVTEWFC